MVMTSVNRMILPSTNIAAAYSAAGDAGQELVLNLALFLLVDTAIHKSLSLYCTTLITLATPLFSCL